MDDLQDFEIGGFGGGNERGTLGVSEVGGHGDDGTTDLGAEEVGGRVFEAEKVAGGDLRDGNRRGCLVSSLLEVEGGGAGDVDGVGRGVGVGGVDACKAGEVS